MQSFSGCRHSDICTKHASFYHVYIMSILFQYHALKMLVKKLKYFAWGVKSDCSKWSKGNKNNKMQKLGAWSLAAGQIRSNLLSFLNAFPVGWSIHDLSKVGPNLSEVVVHLPHLMHGAHLTQLRNSDGWNAEDKSILRLFEERC